MPASFIRHLIKQGLGMAAALSDFLVLVNKSQLSVHSKLGEHCSLKPHFIQIRKIYHPPGYNTPSSTSVTSNQGYACQSQSARIHHIIF